MPPRRRLDAELVRRGLAPSREQAGLLIGERQVLVDGVLADKSARRVDPAQAIQLIGPPPPFVSRAGGKLAGALDAFELDPSGLVCLDAGSSTGGFTDCLLQRGALRVHAVDVGTNQLHERLRADRRVEVREQTDIRSLEPGSLGPDIGLTVGDLSFISLLKVLPALVGLTAESSPMLLLIKPQFEAGRQEVSRGKGVIADPEVWQRVLLRVAIAANAAGAAMLDVVQSSVTGTTGNVEFVGRFENGRAERVGPVLVDRIARVVAEARP